MTVFIDASAMTAIIGDEPERLALESLLERHDGRLTSGLALWEAARAVSRGGEPDEGLREVRRYCTSLRITVVPIGVREAEEAIRAHVRFGKGTGHPAQLNMGDCFAYACARTNDAALLYKGDDFAKTDLA